MSRYSARDIHRIDQASPDAWADVDDLANSRETAARLAERGEDMYAVELARDLEAQAGSRMALAGFAAMATIRRVQDRDERNELRAEQLPTVGRWPGAAPEPVDLDALTALADAATRGPWTAHSDGLVWAQGPGDPVSGSVEVENAEYIAAAANAVPALVDEVRRLRAEVAAETKAAGQ